MSRCPVDSVPVCRRVALTLVIALSLSEAFLSSPADAAEPVIVEIPEGVGDWVVRENAGRVFASLSGRGQVVEYDHHGREVRRYEVGDQPGEMILKGDQLVVACKSPPSLQVLDLKTNSNRGAITLSGTGPYGLFCSEVENGYVYADCNTGSGWTDGEVFQCDLKTMQVRRRQRVQAWGHRPVLNVAMSPDGKWIVTDARGEHSPSGARLMNVDEDAFTFTQVHYYHQTFSQIVAGPINRYWTFGNTLYTLDITKSVREFSGSPVAIHPRLDLAASRTSSGLVLERFSDAAPIAVVPLPSPPAAANPSPLRTGRPHSHLAEPIDPSLQFDLDHQLLFYGSYTRGCWIDLSAYEDQLSPLMIVQLPPAVTAVVGQPLRIPIAVTHVDDSAELTMARGPEGAKLDRDGLIWHPQADDVGLKTIRLEVRSTRQDRMLDVAEITTHVKLPTIDLGFYAKTMELAPGGRYLLVWGLPSGEEDRHPAHTGPDNVAVIDLHERKVLARKTLAEGVRCATINDQHVYIAPHEGNLLRQLDWSLTTIQQIPLQSTPRHLITAGNDRLVVAADQFEIFETEKLERAQPSFAAPRLGPLKGIRFWGGNQVQVGGRLIDCQTGRTLRVVGPTDLPVLVQHEQRPPYNPLDYGPQLTGWGRRLTGDGLNNHAGQLIVQWPGERWAIFSERWPMAILVGSTADQAWTTTTMELAELVNGHIKHRSVIDISANRTSTVPNFYGTRNLLLASGDRVVVLKGTEVLLATIPHNVAESMTAPTHFLPQQQIEIPADEAAQFPLAVGGNTDGVTFRLREQDASVALDAETGTVSVDAPKLWESFVKQIAHSAEFGGLRQDPSLATFLDENAKRYRQLTGKDLPADAVVAELPISALLQGAGGHEDGIRFQLLVVGSRQQLKEAVAAQQAEQARQLSAMQEAHRKQEQAQAQRAPAPQAQRDGDAEASKEVLQRIEAIEVRTRRIEAALDSILRRLDARP